MTELEFNTRLDFINRRLNVNRGYRKLIVWQESLKLYSLISFLTENNSRISYKTINNIVDATHSISRNIAEGYGRKSKLEYLRFLDIAIGSCAEVHSGYCAWFMADQITKEEFEKLDVIHYKI